MTTARYRWQINERKIKCWNLILTMYYNDSINPREVCMIDHTGINVSNFEESKKFYVAALAPLGYELLKEFDAAVTSFGCLAGFGVDGKPDFWIGEGQVNTSPVKVGCF
jgi:hypothetical protein